MHTTDIERMRAQIRRTASKAEEIIEEADTIGDAGFDPSESDTILQQQRELLEEVAQSLSDFDELLNRAERVESDRIEYSPSPESVSVEYDEEADDVTIEYTGEEAIPNGDMTVMEADTEISPFGGRDVAPDESVTVDVSELDDDDEVTVEVTQHRVLTGHEIKPWGEVLGEDNATAPDVDSGSLELPEHNLTEDTQTFSRQTVVRRLEEPAVTDSTDSISESGDESSISDSNNTNSTTESNSTDSTTDSQSNTTE